MKGKDPTDSLYLHISRPCNPSWREGDALGGLLTSALFKLQGVFLRCSSECTELKLPTQPSGRQIYTTTFSLCPFPALFSEISVSSLHNVNAYINHFKVHVSCYGASISPLAALSSQHTSGATFTQPSLVPWVCLMLWPQAASGSTYNSHNISLSHILNRVCICLRAREQMTDTKSQWNQWKVCYSTSLGCRIMVYVQNDYKCCSSGWSESVLANSPALRRRLDLVTSKGSFHPKTHGLLGMTCQHVINVDAVLSHLWTLLTNVKVHFPAKFCKWTQGPLVS